MPGGIQELAKVTSGDLSVLVVGIGARMRLNTSNRDAPENRRVVIELWRTRSVPI